MDNESNWTVDKNISVHCIGCGQKSPSQEMPTPLCPYCGTESKWRVYLNEYVRIRSKPSTPEGEN